MAHPFMPYITEEIWQKVKGLIGKDGATIMLQPFPIADESVIDLQASQDIEWLKGVIVGIRNIRGEMNIAPGKTLNVLLRHCTTEDRDRLTENRAFLKKLAKLGDIRILEASEVAPMSATQLVGKMDVLVPMSDLIDKDVELARLSREVERLQKEVTRLAGKLSNEKFVSKAPSDVVEKERAKLSDTEAAKSKLEDQMDIIRQL